MKALTNKHETVILAVLLVACWLSIQLVFYSTSESFQKSEITDTDSFTRLVRVEQLAKSGSWFDSTIHRDNYPYGDTMHWTRPLDMLLLPGAWAGTPFFGFRKALLLWGIIFNPLLGALALILIQRVAGSYLDLEGGRLLTILFFCQYAAWETFIIGHPDHHGLIILLFLLLMGSLFRMADEGGEPSAPVWAGLIAGLGFWVSVEFITVIILVLAAILLFWLWQGEGYLKKITAFNLSLLISITVFLFVERPLSGILAMEYDKISAAHLIVFALSLVTLLILQKLPDRNRKMRLCSLGITGAVALVILRLLLPDFFGGPFVNVNPAIVPIWLDKVQEVQPLLSSGGSSVAAVAGNLLLSIISIAYMIREKRPLSKHILVPAAVGILIFVPLSFYQVRWYRYAALVMVFAIAPGIRLLVERISAGRPGLRQRLARVLVILIFCAGPLFGGFLADFAGNDASGTAYRYPDLKPLCLWMNKEKSCPAGSTVLACLDYGPEILYRTDFNVIASPYHRNDTGILYSFRAMEAKSDAAAEKILRERPVDLILVSPGSLEEKFYDLSSDTFYGRLVKGKHPAWLELLQLPPALAKEFRLYRVNLL